MVQKDNNLNCKTWASRVGLIFKLDGVGPVDNKPSTKKLHHFVKKQKTWQVTRDKWHMTPDRWHLTRDMRHMVGGEHSFKMSAPQLLRFGIYSVLKILNKMMTQWINQSMSAEGVYRTAPATTVLLTIYDSLLGDTNLTPYVMDILYWTNKFCNNN